MERTDCIRRWIDFRVGNFRSSLLILSVDIVWLCFTTWDPSAQLKLSEILVMVDKKILNLF